jgi:hypothetical protein
MPVGYWCEPTTVIVPVGIRRMADAAAEGPRVPPKRAFTARATLGTGIDNRTRLPGTREGVRVAVLV